MKLIAIRDFSNNVPDKLDIKDALHDRHVHKGAIFTVGDELPFDKLTKPDQALVALLNYSKCVGDATNKDVVARVQAEIAAEKKAAEALKGTERSAGSNADLIAQLIAALKGSTKAA